MKNTDLVKFLVQRLKRDKPKAFFFRLLRMAIILPYKVRMALWWRDCQELINGSFVATIQGSKMKLGSEGGISRDLLYNGLREPYATKKFSRYIKPGDVVIDIGANIGYYALQEARLVGEYGKVYAIEPVGESVRRLKNNIALNYYRNIEVFEMAVGDRNGDATLFVNEESNLSGLSDIAHRDYQQCCLVPLITLDKFIEGKRHPDVIRMDVEGYEYEIVKGMKGLLMQDIPLILFIEFHLDILGEKVKWLARLLRDGGFEVVKTSVEPHPAVMKSQLGIALTAFCDKQIGAPQGYFPLTIDELINNDLYSSGQVEWLEVIFGR